MFFHCLAMLLVGCKADRVGVALQTLLPSKHPFAINFPPNVRIEERCYGAPSEFSMPKSVLFNVKFTSRGRHCP